MPRWRSDGFERLQAAALDLVEERGYERTTVADIAQRAGLTTRSFYNHFPEKREALFGLAVEFHQEVLRGIEECPQSTPLLDVVVHGLVTAATTVLEGREAAVRRRAAVVAAVPELRERELSKRAGLRDAVAVALTGRGADVDAAVLAAGAGLLVLETAERISFRTGGSRPMRDLLDEAARSLQSVFEPSRVSCRFLRARDVDHGEEVSRGAAGACDPDGPGSA